MNYYNSETLLEQQREIENLREQNAALAAQANALHSHRRDLLDMIYNCAIGQVSMGYAVDAESLAQSAYSITGIDAASNRKLTEPESLQHHLREVRAEAAYSGYVAGWSFQRKPLEPAATQYADQIRRGEVE